MAFKMLGAGVALLAGAIAQEHVPDAGTLLMQLGAEGGVEFDYLYQMEDYARAQSQMLTTASMEVVHTLALDSYADATGLGDAPEWCKNETELSWKQRKERFQQHTTLQWAKTQVKKLRETNETIPVWMDEIVSADEKRGRTKWAVQEAKRMQAEGKEVPEWMKELVVEGAKWANRWAACKVVELKANSMEVPPWMVENGRKGVMEYASEKAAEIQEQMDELEQEREVEESVLDAHGDTSMAKQRMLARTATTAHRSASEQLKAVRHALENLDNAEQAWRQDGAPANMVKRAIMRAHDNIEMMEKILQRTSMKIKMTEMHQAELIESP